MQQDYKTLAIYVLTLFVVILLIVLKKQQDHLTELESEVVETELPRVDLDSLEESTAEPTPKEVEDPKICKEKPLWINGGRVFKKRQIKEINPGAKSSSNIKIMKLKQLMELKHFKNHCNQKNAFLPTLSIDLKMKKMDRNGKQIGPIILLEHSDFRLIAEMDLDFIRIAMVY